MGRSIIKKTKHAQIKAVMVETENTAAAATQETPAQQIGDVIHLTNDKGVIKKIVKVGEDGPAIETGQEVLVNYTGRLTDGTVFDSSIDKEALKVNIGVGQVIKGWDIGLEGMREGGRRTLQIPSALGYGKRGAGRDIPPNSDLTFEVQLVRCK